VKLFVFNKRYDDFFVVADEDEQRLRDKIVEECIKRGWDDADCYIKGR
jgi:hypothetical protein